MGLLTDMLLDLKKTKTKNKKSTKQDYKISSCWHTLLRSPVTFAKVTVGNLLEVPPARIWLFQKLTIWRLLTYKNPTSRTHRVAILVGALAMDIS